MSAAEKEPSTPYGVSRSIPDTSDRKPEMGETAPTPHNPGLSPNPGDSADGTASGSGGLPSDVEPDPSQQPG